MKKGNIMKALKQASMRHFSRCQSGHVEFFDWYLSEHGQPSPGMMTLNQMIKNAINYDMWLCVKVKGESITEQAGKYEMTDGEVTEVVDSIDRLIGEAPHEQ